MGKFGQPSIDERGGIQVVLDEDRALHFGHGYDEFDLYCRLDLPDTNIARLMNIRTTDTVRSWKRKREELLQKEGTGR